MRAGKAGRDAIERFFANYPRFTYDPRKSFWGEFYRLRKVYEWDQKRPVTGESQSTTVQIDHEADGNRPDEKNKAEEEHPAPETETYPEAKKANENFRKAMFEDFGEVFRKGKDDPDAWEELCEMAGVNPIPEELKGRLHAIMHTHINIVDMHEKRLCGLEVERFSTLQELRQYTKDTKKFYRKKDAYDTGLLRYLLREIRGKYLGSRPKANEDQLDEDQTEVD